MAQNIVLLSPSSIAERGFAVPTASRLRAFGMVLAFLGVLTAHAASAAADESTRIAYQLYEAMMGRFARGTPAETVPTLRILTEVAPDIAEVQYLYAIAIGLGGGGEVDAKRAQAAAAAALTRQPQNPFFQIAALLNDDTAARRLPDGSLVMTDEGAMRLKRAIVLLASLGSANARALSRELDRIEPDAGGKMPNRLASFGTLAKQAGLLTLKVEENRFRGAESAIIARIDGGPQRVSGEDRAYRTLEARADTLIAELTVASPERVRQIASDLKRTLAEMGQVVERLRGVVTDLAAIFGPLRRGSEQLANLGADVAALEARRREKEAQLTALERQRRMAAPPVR